MSDPTYLKTSPFTQQIQQKELVFHLYIHHFYDTNQASVANPRHPNRLGETISNDWDIFDGLGPKANLVAHARGLNMATSKAGREGSWLISQNIVFVDARFKGSSLQWTGNLDGSVAFQGDGSIVGGTGEFEYGHGVVTIKTAQVVSNGRILDLQIRCRVPLKSTPPTKSALSGGNGGNAFDIPELPQRLESVTIGSGDVIDSIAFSYTDQAGKKKTVGPWGGAGGLKTTILLAPSEIVKKVFGTTGNFGGNIVVTSLTIFTSVTTYGPFGKALGTTFSIPEKDNSNVVGFFARAGDFVDALGVYASPN